MRRVVVSCALVAAVAILPGRAAFAACHHFMIAASPNPVSEGATVTVTVSRDAALAPSNVDVSTVDETARAGQDYAALRQTVNFTNETSRSFQVATTDDNLAEGPQTFRLHLSNPGGCSINPNYVVDPDARVTIQEDSSDAAASTTATPAATAATARAPVTPSATAAPHATPTTATPVSTTKLAAPPSTATTVSSTSSTLSGQAVGKKKGGGGGSGAAVAGGIAGIVVAAGGGGFLLYRLRRRPA